MLFVRVRVRVRVAGCRWRRIERWRELTEAGDPGYRSGTMRTARTTRWYSYWHTRLFGAALVGIICSLLPSGSRCGDGVAVSAVGADRFPPRLLAFCGEKEQQARRLASQLGVTVSPRIWEYFQAARKGDWLSVSNRFEDLRKRSSQYQDSFDDKTVGTPVWQTVIEVQTALDAFAVGEPKYATAFGDGIIGSIPPGSIYFGGTDWGRGVVTALSKSHEHAEPFYTITQNALADARYLEYLEACYGRRIHVPTKDDAQRCFQDYVTDAQRRFEHDKKSPGEPPQCKSGEDIRIADGRVQVSGQVAVMSINGLLTKVIFDHNTNMEFFVEESFPLDWMYPHLSPHGLIFKLERSPLPSLPAAVLDADHAFWESQCASMLGAWLKPGTTVKEVCSFVQTVYVEKDHSRFTGDRAFVGNGSSPQAFGKLRVSIAGLYAWRLNERTDSSDKTRLRDEADLAFRQAFALCPGSPEILSRYLNLLASQNRLDDAFELARVSRRVRPDDPQITGVMERILALRKAATKAP